MSASAIFKEDLGSSSTETIVILFADLMNSTDYANILPGKSYALLLDEYHSLAQHVTRDLKNSGKAVVSVKGDELCLFLRVRKYKEEITETLLDAVEIGLTKESNDELEGGTGKVAQLRNVLGMDQEEFEEWIRQRAEDEAVRDAFNTARGLKFLWLVSEFNRERVKEGRPIEHVAVGINLGEVHVLTGEDGEERFEGPQISFGKRMESFSREGRFTRIVVGPPVYRVAEERSMRIYWEEHPIKVRDERFKGILQPTSVYEVNSFHMWYWASVIMRYPWLKATVDKIDEMFEGSHWDPMIGMELAMFYYWEGHSRNKEEVKKRLEHAKSVLEKSRRIEKHSEIPALLLLLGHINWTLIGLTENELEKWALQKSFFDNLEEVKAPSEFYGLFYWTPDDAEKLLGGDVRRYVMEKSIPSLVAGWTPGSNRKRVAYWLFEAYHQGWSGIPLMDESARESVRKIAEWDNVAKRRAEGIKFLGHFPVESICYLDSCLGLLEQCLFYSEDVAKRFAPARISKARDLKERLNQLYHFFLLTVPRWPKKALPLVNQMEAIDSLIKEVEQACGVEGA